MKPMTSRASDAVVGNDEVIGAAAEFDSPAGTTFTGYQVAVDKGSPFGTNVSWGWGICPTSHDFVMGFIVFPTSWARRVVPMVAV